MKRILGFLTVLSAAALLAVPAQAEDSWVVMFPAQDPIGDAAARADIGLVRETRTESAVTVTAGIRQLWGYGMYYVDHDANREGHTRIVVRKEVGKAPVATMAYQGYELPWRRVDCPLGVTWDADRNFVSVRIPSRCETRVMHTGSWRTILFEAGGARDALVGHVGWTP